MKKSNPYNVNKFLEDSSFVNWSKGINKNDIEYWNTWILNNPEYIDHVETAKALILGINFNKKLSTVEKVDQELSKILPLLDSKKNMESQNFGFRKGLRNTISLATAAILLFLVSWFGFQFYIAQNTTIHKTNYGEIIDLKLPEGTSVVLNGNSEIKYKKNNPRDIFLKGEAYFNVKSIPATNAKFFVHTADLKVEVLGTQFQVSTRQKQTEVVLDEGSIHLELNNGKVKKMIPGELISFSKNDEKLVHKKVTIGTPYALWRGGTYTFNEIPLQEVMTNLEFTYGLKAKYETPRLKNLIITGGIPNYNIEICITALEKATGTRIALKDNTLLIQEN